MSKSLPYAEALKKAVHVSDEISLKTAIKQRELIIISSEPNLYDKMVKKFPKAKVMKNASIVSKIATGAGLLFPPLLIPGILGMIGTSAMDEFKDYDISVDYNKREVIFVKTKGNPYVKWDKKSKK